jgi:hypothetical protein
VFVKMASQAKAAKGEGKGKHGVGDESAGMSTFK